MPIKSSDWAADFWIKRNTMTYNDVSEFLQVHDAQLEAMDFPKSLREVLEAKLKGEVFDAGQIFGIQKLKQRTKRVVVLEEKGLKQNETVFLIDHALTFEYSNLAANLGHQPELVERLAEMMMATEKEEEDAQQDAGLALQAGIKELACDLDDIDLDDDFVYPSFIEERRSKGQTSSVSSGEITCEENLKPRWPIAKQQRGQLQEEVLALMWFYSQSFMLKSGVNEFTQLSFLLDEFGTAIRHSNNPNFSVYPFFYFANKDSNPLAYSIAWPLRDIQVGEEIRRDYVPGIKAGPLRSANLYAWFDVSTTAFHEAYNKHTKATKFIADRCKMQKREELEGNVIDAAEGELKIFTDIDFIKKALSSRSQKYRLVSNVTQADVAFVASQEKEGSIRQSNPSCELFSNNFPRDVILSSFQTLHLPTNGIFQNGFFPDTYDLSSQLATFVGDFLSHEHENESNVWTIRPASGMTLAAEVVSDNLCEIIRRSQTLPMICQRYTASLDVSLQVVVLVRSFTPLNAGLSPNVMVRSSVDNSFIPLHRFKRTVRKWDDIFKKICIAATSLLQSASQQSRMLSQSSRAIYVLDVQITKSFEPQITGAARLYDRPLAMEHIQNNVAGLLDFLFFNQKSDLIVL